MEGDEEDPLVFPNLVTTFEEVLFNFFLNNYSLNTIYIYLLDDLPLFKYYKHLDKDLDNNKNACADFLQEGGEYTDLTEICGKLIRNLHNISQKVEDVDIDNTKRCKYLKYWLYDNILTLGIRNNEWILNQKWQDELEKHTNIDCRHEPCYESKDFHIMDIIVDFYEYYHRTDDMEHAEKKTDAHRRFIKFFKEIFTKYKSMENMCLNQNGPEKLCKKFRECDENCRSFLSTIEPKVKKYLEVEAKSYNVLEQFKQTFGVLIEKASGNIGSSIGVSAGSMAGISFISLILYKFTPFGSFVRPFIINKIGNFKYLEGENDMLAHSHQMMELNSNKRRYNFAYHSVTNS
ncbi:PIR protein [Plasmodium vivax]|nr:PIR protein [Plasmodium vivax]